MSITRKNKVLCHYECGTPEEVIRLEERELSNLQPHDILLETQFVPVNPADINMLEGKYAIKPELPCPLGYDGVGIVTDVGSEVTDIFPGDHVIIPTQRGTWCQYRIVSADNAIVIPKDIPLQSAAMLNVNPFTALLMLESFVSIDKGDWIIQNAANSGVGRAVIDIAKRKSWKTVNIVRRQELVEELTIAGGDIVMTLDDLKSKKLMQLLPNVTMKLALNGVGGESARHIARPLCKGGFHITYGAMGREPLMIDNGLLIFRDITVKGFMRSDCLRALSSDKISEHYATLAKLASDDAFQVPVEQVYPFEECAKAVEHAQQGARSGKILMTPQ